MQTKNSETAYQKVWNPVENEEGPRIFLSTVLFEARLSPLNK
jgi:hypothetical protein